MISWLQGEKVDIWREGTKQGIVLACSGVGYEVQLTPRHQVQCESKSQLILWIHQINREECTILYGFPKKEERDLFRTLIGVNGVGPQIALALLEESFVEELIEAIVEADIKKLTKAQGIGKKIAERISLELSSKLCQKSLRSSLATSELSSNTQQQPISPSSLADLLATLNGLGFEDLEIHKALKVLLNTKFQTASNRPQELPSPEDTDGWIKASLVFLCQEAA